MRFALTEAERRSLQEHAKAIESYEDLRKIHEARLHEPTRQRVADLIELGQSHGGPTTHPGGSPLNADGEPVFSRPRGLLHEEMLELLKSQSDVEAGLYQYDKANKPALTPWDTPAKILETINATIGPDAKERRKLYRLPAADESGLYKEIHDRVREFYLIAPSVLDDFELDLDAAAGIRKVKDWCRKVMSPLTAARSDDGTPQGDASTTSPTAAEIAAAVVAAIPAALAATPETITVAKAAETRVVEPQNIVRAARAHKFKWSGELEQSELIIDKVSFLEWNAANPKKVTGEKVQGSPPRMERSPAKASGWRCKGNGKHILADHEDHCPKCGADIEPFAIPRRR